MRQSQPVAKARGSKRRAWHPAVFVTCLMAAMTGTACTQDPLSVPGLDNNLPDTGGNYVRSTPTPTPTTGPTTSGDFNASYVPGLTAHVYLRGADQSYPSPPPPADIAAEMAWAQNRTPDYAFVDTSVNPNGGLHLVGMDTTPLNAFFTDATGPLTFATADLNTTIANWTGYLRINQPGDYNVIFAADDGGSVFFDGTQEWGSGTLVAQANWQEPVATPGRNLIHVSQAGDYPIQVFWFNQYSGGTGNSDILLGFNGAGPVAFVCPP